MWMFNSCVFKQLQLGFEAPWFNIAEKHDYHAEDPFKDVREQPR